MNDLNAIVAALIIGFLGSVHCIGMCGGICTFANPNKNRFIPSIFNLGRICCYTLLGAVVAWSSHTFLILIEHNQTPLLTLRFLAACIVLLMGLHISGWFHLIQKVEHIGQPLWRRISPLTRRLLPIDNLPKAFIFGFLWGFLPCGLVYSTLSLTLVSESALQGSAIMLAFGFGTLPSMLATGHSAHWILKFKQTPSIRQTLGLLLSSYALFLIYQITSKIFNLPAGMIHHH